MRQVGHAIPVSGDLELGTSSIPSTGLVKKPFDDLHDSGVPIAFV
jgi:hypothetical protein